MFIYEQEIIDYLKKQEGGADLQPFINGLIEGNRMNEASIRQDIILSLENLNKQDSIKIASDFVRIIGKKHRGKYSKEKVTLSYKPNDQLRLNWPRKKSNHSTRYCASFLPIYVFLFPGHRKIYTLNHIKIEHKFCKKGLI